MGALLMIVGIVLIGIGFVCSIIVLIDAFKNEVWKGIASILCGLYGLYYMFVEFQHERRTLIVVGALLGGFLGAMVMSAGMSMMSPTPAPPPMP